MRNVEYMHAMFHECKLLKSIIGLPSFNVSKVFDMNEMFDECYELESIDVSNWDTSNAARTANVFRNCLRLNAIDLLPVVLMNGR